MLTTKRTAAGDGQSRKEEHKHAAVLAVEDADHVAASSTRLGRTLRITGAAIVLVSAGLVLNVLQILTIPIITLFSHPLAHHLNSLATKFAWTITDYFVQGQDNVRLTFSGGEDIPEGESAYVICNHTFFGDFFLIHAMARRYNMMQYCRYFLKDSIKYIPIFGWGMYLANMPFLKRNWQHDNRRIGDSLKTLMAHRLPVWLVSHVEGSRISPEKRRQSQKYAREHNLPVLQHLLLPRCKGFVAIVQALRGSHINHIYDITVAYFHRQRGFGATPSLLEILTGGLDQFEMHVHIDRIPLLDLPSEEAAMSRWLYTLYEDKDVLMEGLKTAFARGNRSN